MAPNTAIALRKLEGAAREFGPGCAVRKLDLLRHLSRTRMTSAAQLLRYHEVLCFLRAYPDDSELLYHVVDQLSRFGGRPELRRFRAALVDTGVAGAAIHFPFHWVTARWLCQHFADLLHVDWDAFGEREADRFEQVLPLLLPYAEWPDFDLKMGPKQWLYRLKGDHETDASFLVRRFVALEVDPRVRESLFHDLGKPMRLDPGEITPSRTHAWLPTRDIAYQSRPLSRQRPDLRRLLKPRSVRTVRPKAATQIIDLARAAMISRGRDLDGIMYAHPKDVRLVDAGGGLSLACLGLQPEHRALVEAIYVFLLLKNGVPIGYFQSALLFESAEVNFHIFPSFRGAEAADTYARCLSVVRHLFGVDTFSIHPYQLGHENKDALEAGAFWFYAKLGFRPEEPKTLALFEREVRAMRRRPGHRSAKATLERLARNQVYLYLGKKRDDVAGKVRLSAFALVVSDYLAHHYGAERERGLAECGREAAVLLGVAPTRWRGPERLAWERWAPLVLALPGVECWSARERKALGAVIRAKGADHEQEFSRRLDRFPKLRSALMELCRQTPL